MTRDSHHLWGKQMALLDDVRTLLSDLGRAGWGDYLLRTQGLNITASNLADELSRPLTINRQIPGFEDFAQRGTRAIEPGDPGLSLLYHALASPRVRPTLTGGAPLPEQAYPRWEQLDVLENYIYSLAPFSPEELKDAVIGVFAYEYRPVLASPHRQHADLAFSRTGLARVGTSAALYKGSERSYTPITGTPDAIAVLPARYGVFLARWHSGTPDQVSLMGNAVSGDAKRRFLYPVRKLFSGSECIPGQSLQVQFSEHHRSEKLQRIVTQTKASVPPGLDIQQPPFFRQSPDPALVNMTAVGSTVMISAPPAPLVRVARQRNSKTGREEIARFIVPADKKFIGKSLRRHYTSMMIVHNLWDAVKEYIEGELHLKAHVPRNGPEFVHIRRQVINDGQDMTDLNQLPDETFYKMISDGGYEAAMFEDGVCDGCVTAFVDGLGHDLPTQAAFSIVAAPSFFPRADELDLEAWALANPGQFREGSPQPLCEGRYAANPHHTRPLPGGSSGSWPQAFDIHDQTVTSVVGRPYNVPPSVPSQPREISRTSFLTDAASNEFFPGWDVTIAQDDQDFFYATYGLGSPYAEDVKFCSAANGFWPAASPDSARTFHRTDTPTSIPLLDRELGYAPDHPAVLSGKVKPQPGWDGGYGPYYQLRGTDQGVNYASLDRTDYITNSLEQRFGRALFENLTSEVLITRMECQRLCIRALSHGHDQVDRTKFWLIQADEVTDWQQAGDPVLKGPGYRFEYVLPTSADPVKGQGERMWQAIQPTRYTCHVTAEAVRWTTDGGKTFQELKA